MAFRDVMIALALKGGPEYDAQMKLAAENTGLFGKALLDTSKSMNVATERTWLHNQALFTARRYAFYATLAITGLAYEVFKLGISYDSTIQTARVALRQIFPSKQALDDVISRLYRLSTLSPFLFKDTLTAFRIMYPAFHSVGIGVGTTINTLQAIMNGLSVSGKTSVGTLTRISTQLQHMANIGKPTGQILLALGRDGLQVLPALRKELGLTGASLEQISASGLTAQQVLKAINKYYTTVAPFKGAAFRQATMTLQGNWQMFKDILAQASGSASGGLFMGLESRLKKVNEALAPRVESGKPIGLEQVASAIDSSLTPSTHIILNLFNAFGAAIKTVQVSLSLFFQFIKLNFLPLTKFLDLIGAGKGLSDLFGVSIGLLASIFIIAKVALMPFIIAIDLWKATVAAAEAVAVTWRLANLLLDGEFAKAWAFITGNTVATEVNTAARAEAVAAWYAEVDALILNRQGLASLTAQTEIYTVELDVASVATFAAAEATTAFSLSFLGLLGPIGLVIAALSIYLAYQKQINSFVSRYVNLDYNPNKPQKPTFGNTMKDIFVTPWVNTFENIRHPFKKGGIFSMLGLQHGGTVGSAGWAMVGENGPEMMHLPGGASVHPLNAMDGGGPFHIKVYPQDIYLDSKKIATVLATAITDKEARA